MLIMGCGPVGAQLHQLRGPCGGVASSASYCILSWQVENEMALSRIEIMTETTNGCVGVSVIANFARPAAKCFFRLHGNQAVASICGRNIVTDFTFLEVAPQKPSALGSDRMVGPIILLIKALAIEWQPQAMRTPQIFWLEEVIFEASKVKANAYFTWKNQYVILVGNKKCRWNHSWKLLLDAMVEITPTSNCLKRALC